MPKSPEQQSEEFEKKEKPIERKDVDEIHRSIARLISDFMEKGKLDVVPEIVTQIKEAREAADIEIDENIRHKEFCRCADWKTHLDHATKIIKTYGASTSSVERVAREWFKHSGTEKVDSGVEWDRIRNAVSILGFASPVLKEKEIIDMVGVVIKERIKEGLVHQHKSVEKKPVNLDFLTGVHLITQYYEKLDDNEVKKRIESLKEV